MKKIKEKDLPNGLSYGIANGCSVFPLSYNAILARYFL